MFYDILNENEVIFMSFDGIMMQHLLPELQCLKNGRISKIIESGDTDFILTIRSERQNYFLMLSFSSDFARVHLTKKSYDAPQNPKSLTMLLRKHIEGYFIEDIQQYGSDRILFLKLAGYNEMSDFTNKYLICEIMGRYSNMILADKDFKIIEVLKRDGVGEFNRTMLPNATYEFPKPDKLNPFLMSLEEFQEYTLSSPKEITNTFNGVSMILAEYCFRNDFVTKNLFHAIRFENQPCVLQTSKGKKDFYFHPLDNQVLTTYPTISELLDHYYFEADKNAKIKLKTNDLNLFIQKQIIKNEKKTAKLKHEMIAAMNAEDYKIMGELLLSVPNLKAKTNQIEVFNYYTNEEQVIDLDPKYDIITNSQRYYKKYQKSKSAIHYINEQIEKASDDIAYFKVLQQQLLHCSLNDALEIRQELIQQKYLLASHDKISKQKKSQYLTYLVENVEITVGKNNTQNEYLTHKLAKPNEYWFHVKDATGSHVIVHSTELSETLIRCAALLAAYYSSFQDSSSVPVDYTQVRNIKKIPGKKNCFVTYTRQKTIYIDPDQTLVESLRLKK